jgi:hypothetical protein
MKQEKPSVAYLAQQINGKLRSGLSRSLAPQLPGWYRDEIQQDPETKEPRNAVDPSFRTRAVQLLGRAKYAACFPLAAAAIPYVRWRGHFGSYLYCLVRRLD